MLFFNKLFGKQTDSLVQEIQENIAILVNLFKTSN